MDPFDQLEQTLRQSGAGEGFDYLIRHFEQRHEYGRMFDAALMKKRHEMGLPLAPAAGLTMTPEQRQSYDDYTVAAARQAGQRFLEAGEIAKAWPYFRALGDAEPVRTAIDRLAPDQGNDAVIDIALGERLHPRKGFEVLLAQHGTCRAITVFHQYPDPATREEALALLARTLHTELIDNLRRVIERAEGAAPAGSTVGELIANRTEWLFGEYCYHVDVSHLMSVVRFAAESDEQRTLEMALEMAEYGTHLYGDLQYRGDPPFEDFHRDHAIYLNARLGRGVDEAIAHFRQKVASYDYDQIGTYPAQTLVRMLLKLGRPPEAVEVFEQFVGETDPAYLSCPPLDDLCRLARDFERLKGLARQQDDLLRYAAAVLEQG